MSCVFHFFPFFKRRRVWCVWSACDVLTAWNTHFMLEIFHVPHLHVMVVHVIINAFNYTRTHTDTPKKKNETIAFLHFHLFCSLTLSIYLFIFKIKCVKYLLLLYLLYFTFICDSDFWLTGEQQVYTFHLQSKLL